MLINHTNHMSKLWAASQLEAASSYGEIIDLPFPNIEAIWTDEELNKVVETNLQKIVELHPQAVLCQGEFVYSYRLISALKKEGIQVIAACSGRKSTECQQEDGTVKKQSIFEFVKFREY